MKQKRLVIFALVLVLGLSLASAAMPKDGYDIGNFQFNLMATDYSAHTYNISCSSACSMVAGSSTYNSAYFDSKPMAMRDSISGLHLYIMFSPEDVHTRFSSAGIGSEFSNHFILVARSIYSVDNLSLITRMYFLKEGENIYDDYFSSFDFTPATTDVIVGEISRSGKIVPMDNGDVILKLHDYSNTHGEVYNGPNYDVKIKYSDIFGEGYYTGADLHTCTGSNKVLGLWATTNAHAEVPSLDNYDVDVCYGDLSCSAKSACATDEKCIVTLSSNTNAHMTTCDSAEPYSTKICCKSSGAVNCEAYTTQADCWENADEKCTWTPPGEDGHCCNEDKVWSEADNKCVEPLLEICNPIENIGGTDYAIFWRPESQLPGVNLLTTLPDVVSNEYHFYCSQIMADASYGYWYGAETY